MKRALLLSLMLALGVAALAAAGSVFPGGSQRAQAARQDDTAEELPPISASALQQIQALLDEKESRTPTQRKIDSQLLYAMRIEQGEPVANGVRIASVNVGQNEGRVVVDITGDVGEALLNHLKANGAEVLDSMPAYGTVQAEIPLERVEAIAASPEVRFVQPKQQAMTNRRSAAAAAPSSDSPAGVSPLSFEARAARVRKELTKALAKYGRDDQAVPGLGAMTNKVNTSEGDRTHRADSARGVFNVNGTGVRIGVLSDGALSYQQAVATGDLPPDVTILSGQAGVAGDEGTAMMEIVHDVAPGAKLFFATAFGSITNFADNIRRLRQAGCDIIVDDVFYFNESPFQDGQTTPSNTNGGVVTQAVNDVTADGALYFSSAGNSGNKTDNTAGVWEGDFLPGGVSTIPQLAGYILHDFDPVTVGRQDNSIIAAGPSVYTLQWSDPLGGSSNDYDLFVLNSAGTAVVGTPSTNVQNGTQDPYEAVNPSAANTRLVIAAKAGAQPRYLHLNTHRGTLSISTPGQTHGHSSAALAYAVAATPAFMPFNALSAPGPYPNSFTNLNVTERFTSDGPRKLYYQPNGTPYTPGNFTSTGGITRQKPDITAADGVSVTGVGGFPTTFYGTSASAPHAAAIAGLVKSARPDLTQAQMRSVLTSTAIDIEQPGVDRDTGAGIVMAYQALQGAGVQAQANLVLQSTTFSETTGNGNGRIETGEKGSLTVVLANFEGGATASNITATLSTTTPGVIITRANAIYPNLAPGASGSNTPPFEFIVSRNFDCPGVINFTMTVNYSGGPSPKTFNFTLTVSRAATINTTLDATPPPPSPDYTPATGLQTGRLVRNNVVSSCGTLKANPGVNAADANVPHRYDSYTFQNTTSKTICVTVTLTTANTAAVTAGTAALQSVAYAPSFNPAVPNENYLGDIGNNFSGVATRSYSFEVNPNTTFVVVVNEVTGGGGVGQPYTLTVAGLPCAPVTTSLVTLQFGQANYSVQEDETVVNVEVTRTGDTSFPVSVDYTTNDGSATQRSDYGKAIGTLNFAAGETTKTIPILINEDSHVEGAETFTVALSNAQGPETNVGATGTTTVTITDDAVEPTTNAIDDSNVFVRQHYHDFLNREGDPAGIAFWVNGIESCGTNAACRDAKRVDTSAAFFLSIEFQETGYFVYRLFKEAYGNRIGGTVPLTFDEFIRDSRKVGEGVVIGQPGALERLEANKQAFALEFVTRPEFLAVYPRAMNEAEFVDKLNANTGGSLSTNERNALVAELAAANNSDAGRASVVRKVAEDADFRAAETNRAFVLMEYFGYLRRNPNDPPDSDFSGYNFWLNKLNSFNGDFRAAEMVRAFITSSEYRGRFGQP